MPLYGNKESISNDTDHKLSDQKSLIKILEGDCVLCQCIHEQEQASGRAAATTHTMTYDAMVDVQHPQSALLVAIAEPDHMEIKVN